VAELLAKLSGRERQYVQLAMLPQVLTEQQMAERLQLSLHTLVEYRRRTFAKLGVDTRIELTRLLAAHGSRGKP